MIFFNRKGQNTAEYAIVIGLVVGAMIAMQTYVKRGIQGQVKTQTDSYKNKVGGAVTTALADAGIAGVHGGELKEVNVPYYLESRSAKAAAFGDNITTVNMYEGGTYTKNETETSILEGDNYRKYTKPVDP